MTKGRIETAFKTKINKKTRKGIFLIVQGNIKPSKVPLLLEQ